LEVLEYLYKLKFDEDPNYGKIEFLFKKIMMVMNGRDKVSVLKRAVEKEFLDLFPNE